MFANLAFRDKIIIFVLSIALIVCVFIFAIFKPTTTKIKELKVVEIDTVARADDIRDKIINQLPVLQETYKKTKEGADKNSARFTVAPESNIKLDEILKTILDENKLQMALSISDPTPTEIGYYYNSVADSYMLTTYPIKESADIDGSIAKSMAEAYRYSNAIKELPAQTVLATTVTIEYRADRKSIMEFIDLIEKFGASNAKSGPDKLDGTIRIVNLSFDDYTFGAEKEDAFEQHNTVGNIEIVFYSVELPHYDD